MWPIKMHVLCIISIIITIVTAGHAAIIVNTEINYNCYNIDDCYDLVDTNVYNVSCIQNMCQCHDNFNATIPCSKSTLKSMKINQPCPCNLENTDCDTTRNICICADNYTTSADESKCIKQIIPLGEICDDSSQCLKYEPFSYCDQTTKICKCLENYKEYDKRCLSATNLHDRCEADIQCKEMVHHSVCKEHKCICQRGFVANKDKSKCLPSSDYGEDCVESTQCYHKIGSGSLCDNGICVCDANHYNIAISDDIQIRKKIICEKRKYVGDICSEHNQCYQYNLQTFEQRMMCLNNECTCLDEYQQVDRYCIIRGGAGSLKLNMIALFICFLPIIKVIIIIS